MDTTRRDDAGGNGDEIPDGGGADTDCYDLAVIGGGSGGYAAARTAAALGLRTVIIDGAAELGGLCILRGCMPSKAMIESADRNLTIRRAREFGLETRPAVVHAPEILERKRRLIREFADYRAGQLQDGPFDLVRGSARFIDERTLEVRMIDGSPERTLRARTFVIATGSEVRTLDGLPGLTEAGYLTSDDLLELDHLPESMVVLGGGAIALEAAHLMEALGVEVTVIQRSANLLTGIDTDVAEAVRDGMERRGIRILTDTELLRVERGGSSTGPRRVVFRHRDVETEVVAAEVLLAVGRVPAVGRLGLSAAGVELRNRLVGTDAFQTTSAPHIFAAGDVCGPHEVVHLAIRQGEVAATNAAVFLGRLPESRRLAMDYRLKLLGIFSHPQVAVVGLGEDEARTEGRTVRSATYPFDDHGKSMVMGETDGLVKLITDAATAEIVGAGVVGPEAVELIHEIVVAMHFHATAADLAAIPHYHPTLSEIWTYPAEELAEDSGDPPGEKVGPGGS